MSNILSMGIRCRLSAIRCPVLVCSAGFAALASISVAAIELTIGPLEIERALRLARSSEAERGRFHAPYQVPVAEPHIEKLEVITEYRRLVIIAEERLAAGDWMFTGGTRAAEAALRPWKQKLTVRARFRFSPTKIYPTPPAISIVIGDNQDLLVPTHVTTDPQYALRTNPSEATPMIGVVVESYFDASAVGQRTLPVIVRGPETAAVRRAVDFSAVR